MMKKISRLLWILLMLDQMNNVSAATALLEFTQTPAASQQVLSNDTLVLYYSLRNNTGIALPLTIKLSSASASIDPHLSNCPKFMPAKSSCSLGIQYLAPMQTVNQPFSVKIDYQGRRPLIHTISMNISETLACRLLKKESWQSAFCQSQYQYALALTNNVFNPANQNVVNGQTLGGMFGIYQKTAAGEDICYISCGIRATNAAAPDEYTLFELASVSKTFTASALGKRIYNHQINPLSAIQGDLPSNSWSGESYSLSANESPASYQQLATFSGGVCFSDAPSVNQSNPDQTTNQANFVKDINLLDTALSTCIGGSKPQVSLVYGTPNYLPSHNYYSNSSLGLIAQALIHLDGFSDVLEGDFNGWLCNDITSTLDMPSTSGCLPNEANNGSCPVSTAPGARACDTSGWQSAEYASGYHLDTMTASFQSGNAFPFLPWAGAGGIRSHARDMIHYIRANLNIPSNSDPEQLALLQGMQIAHQPNDYLPVPAGMSALPNIGSQQPLRGGQGYAWVCEDMQGKTICGKIGGHENFRSFLGFSMQTQYGIIILFNTGEIHPQNSWHHSESTPPSISSIGVNMILNSTARA